ncbi:flippase [Candidatus Poribacteria bacterium]|nr:flippase [Candidatus Poribacteria bacterium]MYH79324.1 flippase [Candidatus Poribacteria bacterium]MYK94358.1 flippase [Candidatus Poribacteria bacterium]
MNRIFKNTSSLFSAHLIGRLGSLVITVWLMPRYFTETELGGYFVAIALTNLIAILTEFGIQNPLIREMTLHLQHTRHYLGNALIVRGILSIFAYVIMLISGIFFYTPIIVEMIVFLGLAEITNSIAQLYRCVFRAHEEMKYEAFTVIAERGTFLLISGGAILFGYGLVTVCQVMLAAGCINLILSVGFTGLRFTQLRFQPSREIVRVLMQQALPFAVGNLLNLLYFRIDAIMLPKLSSEGLDANTWYGLAYTIVNAFTILPGAFMMGAMFPVLSRAWEREKGRFPSAYTFSLRWMVVCGFPFAVGLSTLSPEITRVLFSTYTSAEIGKIATALQWLSWAGGLLFVTTAVLAVLRATDKRRAFSVLMGTTAFLNICLNLYLIPRFSHVGAAIAMVISEAYVLIVGIGYISRNIVKFRETFPILPTLLKTVFLSAVMGIGLVLLKGILSVWVLIPLAVLFYGGGIAVLGEFRTGFRFD